MTQKKFTKEMLLSSGLDLPKVAKAPLPANLKLTTDSRDYYCDPALYRSIVGRLNFLTHTRPNLSYAMQTLSICINLELNILML